MMRLKALLNDASASYPRRCAATDTRIPWLSLTEDYARIRALLQQRG